ncbi:SusC/RagA family TonB-linked outer membrane protein [Hoylesella saccharolytica]|uniref:SusC/RagA family TonB-linked outer membrane protein n=1 Tax=Hoylesella saccharolytica TaxID=633701 RepID=UPI0028EC5D04|nr:SusC/RagA family TonB-linked outer membrane protein [Hoylesella saccharolytica]
MKKVFLFLCLLWVAFCNTYGQATGTFLVSGSVTDESHEPLVGVSVKVKNTTEQTHTDGSGKFSLRVSRKPAMLVFSYIGMASQTVTWQGETSLNVVLKEAAVDLSSVVITGYQEIDKRKLSSAITTINMADLQTPSTNSLDQMLQGRIAGLSVINPSSTVGVAPKIRIRGSSSITGNREPIWVVDGIILDDPVSVSAEELNNIDNVNFVGNAIAGLNPDDIERIDILKDVSATALYGVKAANGVIVVTTKRGRGDRPSVSYRGNFGVTLAPTYGIINQMNSKERVEMSEEMLARGLQFKTYQPTNMAYEGELLKFWNKEIDYDTFRQNVKNLKELNTNWMDLLFRTGLSQQHSVSLSGSGKRMDYYVSLSYLGQTGTDRHENMDRLTGMAKINSQLTKALEIGAEFSINTSTAQYSHPSVAPLNYAYQTSRAIPAYQRDGSYFYYDNAKTRFASLPFNVLNELETTGRDMKQQALRVNAHLTWRPWEWLKLHSLGGYSTSNSDEESWADERSFYASQMRLTPYGTDMIGNKEFYEYSTLPLGGELRYQNASSKRYTFRNVADFSKKWDVHHVFASLGTELTSVVTNGRKGRSLGYMPFRGKTFADIDLSLYEAYAREVQRNPITINDNTTNTLSYFSVLTYTYNNKYIANFNLRADGSNRFGQDKSARFLPIWSVSGRWNVHREKLVEKWSWLNELALRASYGVQGNVHPSQTPYLIVKQENYNSTLREFVSTLYQFPNNYLKWEKTVSYNFGVDFSILDDRISGTLDVYHKKGYDQVVNIDIATSNGARNVALNEGDIENKGWELAFNFVPVRTKDLTWSISVNTGQNFNRVTKAGDSEVTWQRYVKGSLIKNGYAVNSLYAYRFKGLDSRTGEPLFYGQSEKDEDGRTIINSQQEALDAAFTYMGKREPNLTGGFSSSIKYKNFTLNALFSFAFGNKVWLNNLYNESGQALPFPQQNMSREFINRWRQPGDERFTNIPALSDEPLLFRGAYERKYPIADNRWDMYNKSDIRVAPGSFLRCRSLSLRYDFTPAQLAFFHLKGGNISFESSNLFVIKSAKLMGRDPEQIALPSGTVPPRPGFSCQITLNF